MASSRSRADACASSRLATLAHATSKRNPTAPRRTSSGERAFARDRVLQRNDNPVLEQVIALLARRVVNAAGDRTDVPIRLIDGDAIAKAPDRGVVVRRPAVDSRRPSRPGATFRIGGKLKSDGSTPITEKTAPSMFRCDCERSCGDPRSCLQYP